MAASTYVGVAGVNRKLTQIPVGVGGVNRACKSAWAGVAGVNRQVFASGTPLSSKAVGSIIKLKESGALVDFYVAKHDYESGLNGAGRTLVVRKDCYDYREWDSSKVGDWASCTVLSWLNSEYKALLGTGIQQFMGATAYYYTSNNNDWSVSTRSDAVFLLSATELGQSGGSFNVEGTALPIASTLQVAHIDGRASTQWTRSPVKRVPRSVIGLYTSGASTYVNCTLTYGSRPAFTLPSSILLNDNSEIIA